MIKYLLGILTGMIIVVIIIIASKTFKSSDDLNDKNKLPSEEETAAPQELGEAINSEEVNKKLVITEHNGSFNDSGYLYVVGDVGNISQSVVTPVIIEAIFYNEKDEIVETITKDFGSLTVGEHWVFTIKSSYKESVKYTIEIKTAK